MSAPRTRFTSPFAPLELSGTDSNTLEQLSRTIVSNYVAQYEQYVLEGGCAGIDGRVWKLVKQRENVHMFAQQKSKSGSGGTGDTRKAIASCAHSGTVQSSDLPEVLTVGSITGTLNDVMYGLLSPTIEVMRVKSTYVDDRFDDAAVLHTIAEPTQDDPFQSLVIKWAQNGLNLLQRSILSYRDFVFMERTGIVHTSTGERLGFRLMHSVEFPQSHELPSIVRGNISICGVFRDNPKRNQVEVFVRGIMDPGGSAPLPLIVRAAADMFTSVAKYVDCSYHKKLKWRLRMHQNTEDRRSEQSPSPEALSQCRMCKRAPSKLRSSLGNSHKHVCSLCAEYVCSSCRIKKTLSHVSSASSKLWQREFAFCGACFIDSCRSDAFTTALQELVLSEANEERAGESISFREDLYSLTSSSECS